MTQTGCLGRKSRLSSKFTLRGRSNGPLRQFPGRLPAGSMLLMVCALSAPAIASPDIGPTSSANVGISLSVAPNFRLGAAAPAMRANGAGEAGPGRLCIASNSKPTLLPVMLLRLPMDGLSVSQAARERTDQLHRCDGAGAGLPEVPQRSDIGEAPTLLIVSPE